MSTKNYKLLFTPIALSVAIIFGIWLGVLMASSGDSNEKVSNSPLSFSKKKESKVEWLLNEIEKQYVDTIDKDKIIEDLIPKVLDHLDPHSTYIPAKNLKDVNEDLGGSFSGIGVQFSIHKDTVHVLAVISGGPSEHVGLLPGDRIVEVDDSLIAGVGVNNNTVMKLLKGKKGTKVKVGIRRNYAKKLQFFTITRGTIPVNSVDAIYVAAENTGYIRVSQFGSRTYNEFLIGLGTLKKAGCDAIIVDMRGNQGGYLQIVAQMVNEFLQKSELIVYTEGKAQPRYEYRANGSGTSKNMRIAVLIDDWSASASEIFAGAIQDNDRGVVLGRRSFGKGLVQGQVDYEDGSAFRITISRYYTPSGRCIQKPYENGNEEYAKDIWNRYLHGEMDQVDSVKLDASEIFETKNGRPVFGGGGIMPDVFIARDTTGLNSYFSKLSSSGSIYRFAIDYTDKNRSKLEKLSTYKDIKLYLDKKNVFGAFLKDKQVVKAKGTKLEKEEAYPILKKQLYGYIIRNTLDESSFFQMMNEKDEVVLKAIELLQKNNSEFNKILSAEK